MEVFGHHLTGVRQNAGDQSAHPCPLAETLNEAITTLLSDNERSKKRSSNSLVLRIELSFPIGRTQAIKASDIIIELQ